MELLTTPCAGCGALECPRCLKNGRCERCPPPAPANPETKSPTLLDRDLLDPLLAARWPFLDRDWATHLLIGGLLTLTGVLLVPAWFLLGYATRIAQRQHRHPGEPRMPSYEDPLRLIWLGLKHVSALLLPPLLVLLIACLPVAFVALFAGGPGRAAVAMLLLLIVYVGTLVVSLVYPLLTPAVELEYLRTGSVTAGLRPGALWSQISSSPGDYFLLTIFYWILGSLAGVGVLLCGVGVLATAPWAAYATNCMLGRYLALQDRHQEQAREEVAALLATDPSVRRPEPGPGSVD